MLDYRYAADEINDMTLVSSYVIVYRPDGRHVLNIATLDVRTYLSALFILSSVIPTSLDRMKRQTNRFRGRSGLVQMRLLEFL